MAQQLPSDPCAGALARDRGHVDQAAVGAEPGVKPGDARAAEAAPGEHVASRPAVRLAELLPQLEPARPPRQVARLGVEVLVRVKERSPPDTSNPAINDNRRPSPIQRSTGRETAAVRNRSAYGTGVSCHCQVWSGEPSPVLPEPVPAMLQSSATGPDGYGA